MQKIIIKIKQNWQITLFFCSVFLLFVYLNLHFINLGFLSLHSMDEYSFHGSLLNMYDGLATLRPTLFFRTGFYSYGFLFFLINFIFTAPFIAANFTAATIFIPRMLSAVFALIGLYYFYKYSRKYLSLPVSILLSLFVILLPAFWANGIVFHPDWFFTAGIMASVYYLSEASTNEKKYWYAVAATVFAFVTKIQAITFFPILILYIFKQEIFTFKFTDFVYNLKIALKSFAIIIAGFVVTNIYIIHPVGWSVFWRAFLDNLQSNATDNGSGSVISIGEKLASAVGQYYFSPLILFGLIILALYFIFKYLKNKSGDISAIVGITFIINLVYLLVFVNKAWQHYYLPVIMLGLFLLAPFISSIKKNKTQLIIISTICLFQLALSYKNLQAVFNLEYKPGVLESNLAISNFVTSKLDGQITSADNILISPTTGLDLAKLSINYRRVFVINGPLSRGMFDTEYFKQEMSKRYGSSAEANYKLEPPKQYIILRKDDIYFDQAALNKMTDQNGYREALDIIKRLQSGELGYQLFAENNLVYIFKRI